MMHQATTYTTTLKSKTKLAKATHLFPMANGAEDGYYEIFGSTIGKTRRCVSLLADTPVSQTNGTTSTKKMKPWELLKEGECKELCNPIILPTPVK